ncbi:MAG: prepilin-type N-terminal cleavage/methylation domain-containing protein [Candidatus Hydrogenedentota bacterium]|nr:MAG: prepilin-type N-terminal cleavage/methylation domain-containing protein [Candidatus Hydrogenedentota bacterium]
MSSKFSFARDGVRRRWNEERGLSLIELLVAMVCISIILVAFTQMFTGLTDSWRRGFNKTRLKENLGVILATIGPDIRSAVPPYDEDAANEINFVGLNNTPTLTNSKEDEIKFHAATRSVDEGTASGNYGSEIQRMYYWLKQDGTSLQIQREKRTSKTTDAIMDFSVASSGGTPFAFHMRRLDGEYYDAAMGTWATTWDAQAKNKLPDLVRLTLGTNIDEDTETIVVVLRPRAREVNITQ